MGLVVLENVEEDEGPWHLPHADADRILALWRLRQAGRLDAIRQHPWIEGYQ
jgi:hypothetical protein